MHRTEDLEVAVSTFRRISAISAIVCKSVIALSLNNIMPLKANIMHEDINIMLFCQKFPFYLSFINIFLQKWVKMLILPLPLANI